MTNAVFFALGFAVLVIFLLISKLMRRRSQRLGTFEDTVPPSQAREQLEDLILQMQEVAREQIAKADTKIRMLNQLLGECEQRKKELEALLNRSPEPLGPTPPPRQANPLHENVFHLQDQGKAANQICEETGLEIGEVEMILGLRKLQKP